jgi:hypothetical protein
MPRSEVDFAYQRNIWRRNGVAMTEVHAPDATSQIRTSEGCAHAIAREVTKFLPGSL